MEEVKEKVAKEETKEVEVKEENKNITFTPNNVGKTKGIYIKNNVFLDLFGLFLKNNNRRY